jgi:dihydroorotase
MFFLNVVMLSKLSISYEFFLMKKIKLIKPDDMHLHLRDGAALKNTVPDAAKRFARAIVMPNLKPPVTTISAAADYKQRILKQVPAGVQFEPLMTLYLTDEIQPETIRAGKESGLISAVKLYPAGVTTNSEFGIKNIENMMPVFREMEACDLPLLIHGETSDSSVDVFDREKIFLEQLSWLIDALPDLRIVLEHITTKAAVDFIKSYESNLAATITVHHLLLNRNDLLSGGIKPHHYCLPVLKRQADQQALIAAATSGDARFFLGTDSAPHAISNKECVSGCAGIYSEHAAIELYAQVFAENNAIDKLEDFASRHGAAFYQLSENTETITLIEDPWTVPETMAFGDESLVPLYAGKQVRWRLVEA